MSNPSPASKPTSGRRHRACPATGGFITPADCGANRGSRLRCPADCPFFPFGTHSDAPYDWAQQGWYKRVEAYLAETADAKAMATELMALQAFITDKELALVLGLLQISHQHLFLNRNAAGRTLADEWALARWRGLNNDERLLTEWRRASHPTVLEIEGSDKKERVFLCRDLLDPDRPILRLHEDELDADVARFTRVYGWLVFLPYCCRSIAPLLRIEHAAWPVWRAAVGQRWQAALQSDPQLTLPHYLCSHFVQEATEIIQLNDQCHREQQARWPYTLRVTTYRLTQGRPPVEAILAAKPEIGRAPPQVSGMLDFLWRCEGESAAFLAEPRSDFAIDPLLAFPSSMGHLRLSEDALLFLGLGEARQAFAKGLLARWLGDLIELTGDRTADIGRRRSQSHEPNAVLNEATQEVYAPPPQPDDYDPDDYDPDTDADADDLTADEIPQPPMLITASEAPDQPGGANSRVIEIYTRFFDTPLAQLDGCSPRAAARDPARRPLLVELMKEHVRRFVERGDPIEAERAFDWILVELGLEELRRPPGENP